MLVDGVAQANGQPASAEQIHRLATERDALKTRIEKKLSRERRWFTAWTWMHYILGIPATLIAAAAAWQGFVDSAEVAAILAAVSGSLIALSTYLTPRTQAERHSNAQFALEELLDDVEDIELERASYIQGRESLHAYKHKLVGIERQIGFAELPTPQQLRREGEAKEMQRLEEAAKRLEEAQRRVEKKERQLKKKAAASKPLDDARKQPGQKRRPARER